MWTDGESIKLANTQFFYLFIDMLYYLHNLLYFDIWLSFLDTFANNHFNPFISLLYLEKSRNMALYDFLTDLDLIVVSIVQYLF